MTISIEDVREVYAKADLLHSESAVESALDRMAEAITALLQDRDPVLLCAMIGGVITAGRLATRLDFPLQMDYVHATRYRGRTTGSDLHWLVRPTVDLSGRTVLIIDDILDEGETLAGIVDYCNQAGAREVLSAVLVEKRHERKHGVQADFIGLTVGDRYVFGYGMDYRSYLRNAAGIYAVRD